MASVRRVQVGRLSVKDYVAKKPVALGPGGQLVGMTEALERPALLGVSLATLSSEDQVKLVIARNELEPEFTLGVFQMGTVSKAQLIEHVRDQTELGRNAVQAELNHVEELMRGVHEGMDHAFPSLGAVQPAPVPQEWRWIEKKWWWLLRATVVFCENTTDSVTTPAANYRIANVHPVFAKRGFNVVVLKGAADNKTNFENVAKGPRVVYLGGIGHGNPTTYTGHLNQPLLQAGLYDAAVVKSKSIHFLSCQTAKQLGPDTIARGAHSYAGYFENFTFVWDDPATPVNEQDLFWKADGIYDLAMALGSSAKEAADQTVSAFNAGIALVPGTTAATWLTWDRNYFRSVRDGAAFGDPASRISPSFARPFLEVEEAFAKTEALS